MVKTRFSSLDVRAMVNSIRPEAVGCKLTNIYDINSKVYILKLARRNFKRYLLLESGVRFHMTDYQRDKSTVPSNYTMKLRKHIRTRRLTGVRQLGADRVVEFTFGRDENAFHLILELYVSGNVILTDHEYKILVLLRTHGDKDSKVSVKDLYPVEAAMGLLVPEPAAFQEAVGELLDKAAMRRDNQEEKAFEQEDREAAKSKSKSSAFSRKKRPDHMAMPLFQVLHKLLPWADPVLCASCIGASARAEGHEVHDPFKVNVDDMSFDETVLVVQKAAELALERLRSVSRPGDLGGGSMPVLSAPVLEEADERDDDDDDEEPAAGEEAPEEALPWEAPVVPGWIIRKRIHVPPAEPYWANDDFTPLLPDPGEDADAVMPYPSFHRCVDEFYVQLEEHKAQEQKAQHAQSVYAKVERIRVDQGRRVEQLEAEQVASERMAEVIEANVELVERALAMLNTMVASQFDWGELWREVKRQQRLGHPIAQHIHAMELARNEVTLLLSRQPDDDEVEAEADEPMQVVPLDLSLSARANVARLHSARKQTREKTSKTMAQAEQAIKHAERKAQQDLQKYHLKQTIRRVRQTWWFEKFHWFLSSENYLVLAARDSAQAELIFRRHVGPRDVFVHADVGGATSCFIKSPDGREVPPATLREAGTAVLCRSVAWDKHIVISPWWVLMDQVCRGKSPPSGDCTVLADGFIVQGQRRFLPPVHLEMGLTLLFHVGGEGAAERHRGERKSRYLEAMGNAGLSSSDKPENSPSGDGAAEQTSDISSAGSGDEAGVAGTVGGTEPPQAQGVEDKEEDGREEVGEEVGEEAGEEAEEEPGEAHDEEDDIPPLEDAQGGDRPSSSNVAAEEALDEQPKDAEASGGRARQSKAERRRVKKGVSISSLGGSTPSENTAAADEPLDFQPPPRAKAAEVAAKAKAQGKAAAPLPRGQRAKQKKIREKYGDQDDEERELRLALLGSKASKHIGGQEDVAAQAGDAEADEGTDDGPSQAAPKARAAPAEAGERRPQPAASKEKRRGGGGPKPQVAEELVRPGCEADQASELQPEQLDILTGQPQAQDEVLYAIPMVAPYCALGGPYSMRVKLTPGSVKKGQAVKTCLRMFEAQLERPAWKQLVQAIPEADTAGMLCGSCKLSMPGLQKLQAQAKREAQKDTKRREREAAAQRAT